MATRNTMITVSYIQITADIGHKTKAESQAKKDISKN